MREMTASEKLSLAKLVQMETDSVALAKAIRTAVSDVSLKELIDSGITAGKMRLEGMQRFINENDVSYSEIPDTESGEVH